MKTIPACLMLLLLAAAGHAAEPLDLTTGREVTVPVEVHGSYQLVAANGRVLAAGTADGCPAFYLAALKPGASEQVDLIADNIKQPLVLHSPPAARRTQSPVRPAAGTAPDSAGCRVVRCRRVSHPVYGHFVRRWERPAPAAVPDPFGPAAGAAGKLAGNPDGPR